LTPETIESAVLPITYDIEHAAAHLHEMIDGKKHKARGA